MKKIGPLDSIPPMETLEMDNGLSLAPRVKLFLTVFRAEPSVRPVDEWQLKRSLIQFFKTSFPVPVPVPDDDLILRRFKDLGKRKRHDPVARGAVFFRDLGFLITGRASDVVDAKALEKKLFDWRRSAVDRLDGMDLNIQGDKFRLTVHVPSSDDFDAMRKEWEQSYSFGAGSRNPGGRKLPDTLVLRGLPSRWFAEPRVSSKPSMLVTHTIFSAFGNIRNLNVAEDNDLGKDEEEDADIVSGLQCKITVQFEKHQDFYNALKVLCGRSLQKEGSRLKADYDITWDKDGIFRTPGNLDQEKCNRALAPGRYESEAPRRQSRASHFISDTARPKRYKF